MKFLHTIKPVILSSDPTGSASGEFYYNSTTGKWRGYNGSSWIDVNSSSAIISSSALISTSAVFSSSGIISSSAIISASVDWTGVSNKPTSIASATISTSAIFSSSAIVSSSADVASEVDWSNVTNQPTSIASATVSASVDWSGVSNKPSSIASATISSSAVVAKSVDWNDVINQPLSIASATVAASVDWAGVSNKPTSIASATISSSAIVSNSATTADHANTASAVDWSGVTNKPTSIASATISSSAIIAASAAAFTGTITVNSTSSAIISSSAIIASSAVISQTALHANTASAIDWSGVTSKPTSIASATISSSAIISSSVSWNGVSDKPTSIASATISSSAIVSASVDWAGVSNKPSTIASATISSSAVVSSSSTFASTSSSATISSSANISASSILSSSAIVSSSVDWSGVANKPDPVLTISLGGDLSGTSSTTFTDLGNASITISAAVLTASTMNVDHIDFSTTASSTPAPARLQWSAGEGTLAFGLAGGNVDLNIGQEEVALCYNGTGSAIPKGTAVYISGAQGQRPSITKASALGESTSSKVLGVTAEDIAAGAEGFICSFGIIRNVNTASFAPGTALWLSASNNGGITDQKTYAPNHLVFIGYSIKQSATAGQMFINPQNGYELYELHNVSAASPSNNDIIVYNSSSGLWVTSDIQSKITTASIGYANVSASSTLSSSAIISSSAVIATHANTASSIAGSLVTGTVASATVANNSASLGGFQASDYARLAAANTWSAVNVFQAGIYVGNGSNSQSLTTQTPVQSIPDGNDAAVVFRRSSSVTTNPVSALHKYDANLTASVSQRMLNFYLNGSLNGFITTNSIAAPAFGGTSDYRLKENIEDFTNSVNLIKEIKVRSFNWKDSGINSIGFIAHELKKVLPIAVDGEKDAVDDEGNPAYQSIMESRLIPYLTGALKDTILKVEKLEESIVQLQNRINELERQ